jgi:hypothetical protein
VVDASDENDARVLDSRSFYVDCGRWNGSDWASARLVVLAVLPVGSQRAASFTLFSDCHWQARVRAQSQLDSEWGNTLLWDGVALCLIGLILLAAFYTLHDDHLSFDNVP